MESLIHENFRSGTDKMKHEDNLKKVSEAIMKKHKENLLKDKVKELIEKAKKASSYQYQEYAGAHYTWFEHDTDTLKLIALITVEEVINGNFGDGYDHQFWECVKAELEVLM